MNKPIRLSPKAGNLKLGKCRHYRGNEYKVLGVVIHSETLEELVLYKALYGKRLLWVRPLDMFLEKIEIKGRVVPQFKYLANTTD